MSRKTNHRGCVLASGVAFWRAGLRFGERGCVLASGVALATRVGFLARQPSDTPKSRGIPRANASRVRVAGPRRFHEPLAPPLAPPPVPHASRTHLARCNLRSNDLRE